MDGWSGESILWMDAIADTTRMAYLGSSADDIISSPYIAI